MLFPQLHSRVAYSFWGPKYICIWFERMLILISNWPAQSILVSKGLKNNNSGLVSGEISNISLATQEWGNTRKREKSLSGCLEAESSPASNKSGKALAWVLLSPGKLWQALGEKVRLSHFWSLPLRWENENRGPLRDKDTMTGALELKGWIFNSSDLLKKPTEPSNLRTQLLQKSTITCQLRPGWEPLLSLQLQILQKAIHILYTCLPGPRVFVWITVWGLIQSMPPSQYLHCVIQGAHGYILPHILPDLLSYSD